jgi:hypothetical protein
MAANHNIITGPTNRQRNHEFCKRGPEHVQPLERGQHRNRRRNGAVAVNQSRAEQPDQNDDPPLVLLGAQQREQRHDATLAVIVDTHCQGNVFDRGDDDQCPQDQGQ